MSSTAQKDKKSVSLVACFRPDGSNRDEKVLRGAWLKMEADSDLNQIFHSQSEFDAPLIAGIQAMPVPDDLEQRVQTQLGGERQNLRSWRDVLRQPALQAALLALAFLIGWGTLLIVQHAQGFKGDDAVAKLVAGAMPPVPTPKGATPSVARRNWLEPVSTECARMADVMFLAHGFDQFRAPAEFAHYPVAGFRVLDGDDMPVAKVVLRSPEMMFLTFHADQRGVSIKPFGRWKFLEGDDWAAAAQVQDGVCFVAACRGTKADIQARLREAGVKF